MSISRQNLSIVIVTLKSENIIHECVKSIDPNIPIIVVENSNNEVFKKDLEFKYKNIRCVLSKSNLGMGAANNIGIKLTNTEYVLIINPDVTLQKNTLDQIYSASNKISEFSILSPLVSDKNFPNYGMLDKKRKVNINHPAVKVDYIDGFAMLINKKKFENDIFFDENFFLYLENNDLCLRVIRSGGSIYLIPSAKIDHKGARTVDIKYKDEVEFSRNWHWVWSKFYYNKKNFGFIYALKECVLIYFSSIIKFLFYFMINNKYKKKIYYNRASGFYNALMGKASWYRPNLEN